jgi:hypothetical protein
MTEAELAAWMVASVAIGFVLGAIIVTVIHAIWERMT